LLRNGFPPLKGLANRLVTAELSCAEDRQADIIHVLEQWLDPEVLTSLQLHQQNQEEFNTDYFRALCARALAGGIVKSSPAQAATYQARIMQSPRLSQAWELLWSNPLPEHYRAPLEIARDIRHVFPCRVLDIPDQSCVLNSWLEYLLSAGAPAAMAILAEGAAGQPPSPRQQLLVDVLRAKPRLLSLMAREAEMSDLTKALPRLLPWVEDLKVEQTPIPHLLVAGRPYVQVYDAMARAPMQLDPLTATDHRGHTIFDLRLHNKPKPGQALALQRTRSRTARSLLGKQAAAVRAPQARSAPVRRPAM
jgi:hypothetical protein